MSDSEELHFESKADAGASKTYPQQAGTIRKNGYLVIENRPSKQIKESLVHDDTRLVLNNNSNAIKHLHIAQNIKWLVTSMAFRTKKTQTELVQPCLLINNSAVHLIGWLPNR